LAVEERERLCVVRDVASKHGDGAAGGLEHIGNVVPGAVATTDERDERGCLD